MKKLAKFVWLLAGLLVLGACSKHDGTLDDVTPPDVIINKALITGIVTDFPGHPLVNATVTSGSVTVNTDSRGVYQMEVTLGEADYVTLTASYPLKKSKTARLSLSTGRGTGKLFIFQQNFRLPEDRYVIFGVDTTSNPYHSEALITNETLDSNSIAQVVNKATIYPEFLTGSEQFKMSVDYEDGESNDYSKATERMFYSVLVEEISGTGLPHIEYDLEISLNEASQEHVQLMQYDANAKGWVLVPSSCIIHHAASAIITRAVVGVIYGLFGNVSIEQPVNNTAIPCNPDAVDNLYGSGPVQVPYTTFSYWTGVNIVTAQANNRNDQLAGLLLERMVCDYGLLHYVQDCQFPLNLTLPIGTGCQIRAWQGLYKMKYQITYHYAKGDVYGLTGVEVTTYNRQHTGGGN